LRWIHPQRGMVMQTIFLLVAEESTLILDIGDGCWNPPAGNLCCGVKNQKMCNLALTVNISAKTIRHAGFCG